MPLEVLTAANAVNTDTNTDFTVPNAYDHPEMFIQVEITATISVQILGKLHASASYVELVAIASAGYIQPVAYMPFIRMTTTNASGTPSCSVYVMVGNTR